MLKRHAHSDLLLPSVAALDHASVLAFVDPVDGYIHAARDSLLL
jgi:hypothetical protein